MNHWRTTLSSLSEESPFRTICSIQEAGFLFCLKIGLDNYYKTCYIVSMRKKSKIDLDQLRIEIRVMSVRSKLHKLLVEELSALGHWKQLPRGKAGFKPKKEHREAE